MSTINQEVIRRLTQRVAETAEKFADKTDNLSAELTSTIQQETEHIDNLINLIFNALKEKNQENFDNLKGEILKSLSELKRENIEMSAITEVLRSDLLRNQDNASGLNTRLDSFSAKVDFLEKHVGSLTTKQHVNDSISRNIAEQNLLLTERLASKDALERIDQRLDGEDGQGGLLGQVNELSQSVTTEIGQIKAELAGKTTIPLVRNFG